VAETPWQKSIRRAEDCAVQNPSSAELLGFYLHLARFQEGAYSRLFDSSPDSFSGPLKPDQLLRDSSAFFLMVEKHGPAKLADVALRLRSTEIESGWPDLLSAIWSTAEYAPSEPQDFLAWALLQPRAVAIRSRMAATGNSSSKRRCPFCGRRPGAGILRQQGDGAARSLLCSFCLGEWEFRRIYCANCGEEVNHRLPVYKTSQFPHIRVECCDTCKRYIKAVDLTKNGLADPVADEIASASLDLWAQEHAYVKLAPNLLGL